MFQQLNAEGITVILVTHDPEGGRLRPPRRSASPTGRSRATEPRRTGADARARAPPESPGARSPTTAARGRRHADAGGTAPQIARTATPLPKPRRLDAADAASRHAPHGAGRAAAQQDAVGADGPGRHHRRGRGDRHDGDRRRARRPPCRRRIASMGANTLMIQSGRGGQRRRQLRRRQRADAHARRTPRRSPASARPSPTWRPSSAPGRRSSTATATGCRCTSTAPRPSYLAVRDWEDLDEGEMFTDRDVRNGSKVCVIGADAGARAVPGRVARRQGNPHPERLVPRDRRAEPQGGEHDGHGPGRHRAGPLDDDQVPRQRHDA